MSQPVLEAPSDAFLSQGSPADRFLIDNLPGTDSSGVVDADHRRAVVLIAGAFLAWRVFYLHSVREASPVPPQDPASLLELVWRAKSPFWAQLMTPSIGEVMSNAGLTGDELGAVANDYVNTLGQYVHNTSASAVVGGFNEQIRRGVNPTLAWLRAIEGYGLEDKRLRSWVAQQTQITDLVSPGARRALDRALLARADVLGQTEGWHARQVAKSVVWMAQEAAGLMPSGTQKRWITRDDELVCPVCGDLHLQEVGLRDRFTLTNGQRLWAPGVHPNCRCELALVYPTIYFEKAAPGDPFDRDRDGQFARQESRTRKVAKPFAPVKERQADPIVQQLLDQMTEAPVDEGPDLLADGPDLTEMDLVGDGPDLLADDVDLLAGGPDLLAGPDLLGRKTTGRRRKIYVMINGKLVEVEGDEIAPQDDNYIYVPVDEYYAIFPTTAPEAPGEPADVGDLKIGDTINFDVWARAAAQMTHQDPNVALPIRGYTQGPYDHPQKLLMNLDSFYAYSEKVSEEEEGIQERIQDQQEALMQNMGGSRHEWVQQLQDDDLVEIYHDAGMHQAQHSRQMSIAHLRDELEQVLDGEEPDGLDGAQCEALEMSASDWAMTNDPELEALYATVEDSRPGFLRVPQLFTFKDNDAGGVWTEVDGQLQPRITGSYRVIGTRVHPLRSMRSRTEVINPRIKKWREVILERIPTEENTNVPQGRFWTEKARRDDGQGGVTDA